MSKIDKKRPKNAILNFFFEKKYLKVLRSKKKTVPLHSQKRNGKSYTASSL